MHFDKKIKLNGFAPKPFKHLSLVLQMPFLAKVSQIVGDSTKKTGSVTQKCVFQCEFERERVKESLVTDKQVKFGRDQPSMSALGRCPLYSGVRFKRVDCIWHAHAEILKIWGENNFRACEEVQHE